MKHYEKLQTLLNDMKGDTEKFYGGNNSAGTRVRKQLQEIKKACNDMRTEVQELRQERK